MALAAFFAGQLVGGIVAVAMTVGRGDELADIDPEALLVGTAVGALVTIPLAVLLAARLHPDGRAGITAAPRRWWWFVIAVGLGLALVLVNAGLTALGTEVDAGLEGELRDYEDQWEELFDGGRWQVAIFVLAVVVLAPLSEELVFRVLLLGGLRRLMPFWPAAALSGALFAAVHLQPAWAITLGLFAAGVGLAWIYRRAGYWAAVATHATVNAIAAVSLLAG